MTNNNLGEKLKNYRKQNYLTQKEFALKLNIARSTLGDYETGRIKGSKNFLSNLCNVTDTSLNVWINHSSEGLIFENLEAIHIYINSLISSGISTSDDPLPLEYQKIAIKLLEIEIKAILNKSIND